MSDGRQQRGDPALIDSLVTILVPTYGRAHYVDVAVRSALAQTHESIEILVLDDASPDDTSAVMAAFRAEPRVRYVRHAQNLGIAGNWRYGIAAARGEFFCLLHDDDTLEPDFVRTLLAPLSADASLALAFCDHSVMDVKGATQPHAQTSARFRRDQLAAGLLSGDALERAVLVDYSIPVGATLFRRSMVDPVFIEDQAKGAIDYWLLYKVLKTGRGAFYVDQRLMNYRAHAGGMSTRSALYMAEGHLFRFDAILDDPQFAAWWPQISAERRRTRTACGIELTQSGRFSEARRLLWTVLRERPSPRATVAFLLSCVGPLGRWLTSRLRTQP